MKNTTSYLQYIQKNRKCSEYNIYKIQNTEDTNMPRQYTVPCRLSLGHVKDECFTSFISNYVRTV